MRVGSLNVVFAPPDAGWVYVDLTHDGKTTRVYASHVEDPFEDLLSWCEAIASGADLAAWRVSEEGRLTQLIYVAGQHAIFDHANAHLVIIRTSHSDTLSDSFVLPVDGRQLVQAFYQGFRAMAEAPNYDVRQWEAMGNEEVVYDGPDTLLVDEGEFRVPTMRSRRSKAVELWLETPAAPACTGGFCR